MPDNLIYNYSFELGQGSRVPECNYSNNNFDIDIDSWRTAYGTINTTDANNTPDWFGSNCGLMSLNDGDGNEEFPATTNNSFDQGLVGRFIFIWAPFKSRNFFTHTLHYRHQAVRCGLRENLVLAKRIF